MPAFILAIDQGTTSSRAIMFNEASEILAVAQQEFPQHFPQDGWVEHDPEDIWSSTLAVTRQAIAKAGIDAAQVTAIGITNQRETTVIWDRVTGEPIHNAIVWQDRRTADYCETQRAAGLETLVTAKTGLLLDPYFSATKVKWLLDNVAGARVRAERGELAFGTIDSFLLWRLTGGQSHKTDATNASRTMLFNIHDQTWDAELLAELDIPAALLPQVEDSAADFGMTQASLFGAAIPIAGMAGDQQAALIGQCCFEDGMTKSTYGTGCFVIMNTGSLAVKSTSKLLTTVAYRLNGRVTYGLEGSIFIAGAAVQWLRDGLGLIKHAAETEAIATAHPDARGVYLVPAFTGLGAPYWDANARGAILGLTRDTGIADIVTATLQSVCYQTRDLMDAMAGDGVKPTALRVDGGMVANDWIAQSLADLVRIPVVRPRVTETTALGAAYLAGLQAGVFASTSVLATQWRQEQEFVPQMPEAQSIALYEGWQAAVARVRSV
ncbi:glycerol kinase GlpK [Pseudomonadales bacterium]|nr:glycerol kinase GlpK [Pseudomonadales bacterium]MDB9880207.1 glycerol kinase GlpK [Pseudomonadales bacterium]MDB9918028.1 glycerol kinase GlpK [Pseudomonadales bacterium]MDC0174316.1 glycerol kinase GlpK [Pseudomonadales bacterium]